MFSRKCAEIPCFVRDLGVCPFTPRVLRSSLTKPKNQKTREGCGCFRGLFGGSRGKLRESGGKIAGKIFPDREMLRILGFRAPGKANLSQTMGPHCPGPCADLPCGVFFEIDSSSLLEFFSEKKRGSKFTSPFFSQFYYKTAEKRNFRQKYGSQNDSGQICTYPYLYKYIHICAGDLLRHLRFGNLLHELGAPQICVD